MRKPKKNPHKVVARGSAIVALYCCSRGLFADFHHQKYCRCEKQGRKCVHFFKKKIFFPEFVEWSPEKSIKNRKYRKKFCLEKRVNLLRGLFFAPAASSRRILIEFRFTCLECVMNEKKS
jgi:hypothetical protein